MLVSYRFLNIRLVVLQVIMPNLSFIGHLSGILSGTFQLCGICNCFAFPSAEYLKTLEERQEFARYVPNFVATPSVDALVPTFDATVVLRVFRHSLETLRVAVFGRGGETNDNIQPLSGWRGNQGDDEEDWAGLPPEDTTRNPVGDIV